jgi:hypothetical protein
MAQVLAMQQGGISSLSPAQSALADLNSQSTGVSLPQSTS